MVQYATPKALQNGCPLGGFEASRDASTWGTDPQRRSAAPPPVRAQADPLGSPPPSATAPSWAVWEFGGARIKDARRIRSLQGIAAALAEHPQRSFTAACGPARRQAAHRLFEHSQTSVDGLLWGHYARTAERCRALPLVLVAQDTCFFVYPQAQIVGLVPVNQSTKSRALLAHAALALTPDGTPLGVLGLACWGEDATAPPRRPGQRLPPEERESVKWREGLEAIAQRLPGAARVLVLADREADIARYLTLPRPAGLHHLVRAVQNRVVTARGDTGLPERQQLLTAVAQAPLLGHHCLSVPRRKSETQQIMLPARQAAVEVRVQALQLRPHGPGRVPTDVWVIETREVDPPVGEPPLHWVLITTEPVLNLPAACAMVGYYGRRWVIERLHFTLKSGLRTERLQIDDAESLGHALAVYYVVAWRLLHLTYLAREEPDTPAAAAFDADELAVLTGATGRTVGTVGEAVLAVAELGGWQRYRKAPPPGVKSLWVGWITLRGMVQGYRLALGRRDPEL